MTPRPACAGEAEVALIEAMVVAHYGGTPADALQGLGVDGLDYERKAMRRVLAVVRGHLPGHHSAGGGGREGVR